VANSVACRRTDECLNAVAGQGTHDDGEGGGSIPTRHRNRCAARTPAACPRLEQSAPKCPAPDGSVGVHVVRIGQRGMPGQQSTRAWWSLSWVRWWCRSRRGDGVRASLASRPPRRRSSQRPGPVTTTSAQAMSGADNYFTSAVRWLVTGGQVPWRRRSVRIPRSGSDGALVAQGHVDDATGLRGCGRLRMAAGPGSVQSRESICVGQAPAL